MGKALALTAGGILTVLLNVLFADRLRAWILWFTQALLALAVERLPDAQRERFAEEWASHVNDISTDIGKVLFARGCVSAAREIASFLGDQSQIFGRVLSRSRGFLQRASKRCVHFLGAAGALLLGEDSMLAKRGLAATILVPTLLLGLAGFWFLMRLRQSMCLVRRFSSKVRRCRKISLHQSSLKNWGLASRYWNSAS